MPKAAFPGSHFEELVGVSHLRLTQLATYYAPGRAEHPAPVARGYLSDASWYQLTEVPTLGFDHTLLREACDLLSLHLRTRPLAFALLPDRFTLSAVQQLYEEILGESLVRRNFRRKIVAYDFLVETGSKRSGVKGGPIVYRIDRPLLQQALHAPIC